MVDRTWRFCFLCYLNWSKRSPTPPLLWPRAGRQLFLHSTWNKWVSPAHTFCGAGDTNIVCHHQDFMITFFVQACLSSHTRYSTTILGRKRRKEPFFLLLLPQRLSLPTHYYSGNACCSSSFWAFQHSLWTSARYTKTCLPPCFLAYRNSLGLGRRSPATAFPMHAHHHHATTQSRQ